MRITSRITTKSQTTVPLAVRAALGVGPGDELGYVIEGDKVVLTKAEPAGREYLKALEATLPEWNDPANDVFDDL